jgi:hypothetical protein
MSQLSHDCGSLSVLESLLMLSSGGDDAHYLRSNHFRNNLDIHSISPISQSHAFSRTLIAAREPSATTLTISTRTIPQRCRHPLHLTNLSLSRPLAFSHILSRASATSGKATPRISTSLLWKFSCNRCPDGPASWSESMTRVGMACL